MTKAEYQKLYLENKKFKEKIENIEKSNNNISREKIDQRSVIEKYQKKENIWRLKEKNQSLNLITRRKKSPKKIKKKIPAKTKTTGQKDKSKAEKVKKIFEYLNKT